MGNDDEIEISEIRDALGFDDEERGDIDKLQDDIESLATEAFSGFDYEEDKIESISNVYSEVPEVLLKNLLENGHGIPAYVTLHSFIDEKINEIFFRALDNTSNISNRVEGDIRRIDSNTKISLLRALGVIDKETSSALRQFIGTRNDLAHQASGHIYTEDRKQNIINSFKRGIVAFNKLRVINVSLYTPDSFD